MTAEIDQLLAFLGEFKPYPWQVVEALKLAGFSLKDRETLRAYLRWIARQGDIIDAAAMRDWACSVDYGILPAEIERFRQRDGGDDGLA